MGTSPEDGDTYAFEVAEPTDDWRRPVSGPPTPEDSVHRVEVTAGEGTDPDALDAYVTVLREMAQKVDAGRVSRKPFSLPVAGDRPTDPEPGEVVPELVADALPGERDAADLDPASLLTTPGDTDWSVEVRERSDGSFAEVSPHRRLVAAFGDAVDTDAVSGADLAGLVDDAVLAGFNRDVRRNAPDEPSREFASETAFDPDTLRETVASLLDGRPGVGEVDVTVEENVREPRTDDVGLAGSFDVDPEPDSEDHGVDDRSANSRFS